MSQARQAWVEEEVEKPRREEPDGSGTVLRWVVAVLCLGALVAIVPFWVPLVIAAWAASLAKPIHHALAKRIHRRKWAGAVITVLLVLAFVTPFSVAALSLAGSAVQLGRQLMDAKSGQDALRALAANSAGEAFDPRHMNLQQVAELARAHGASAIGVAKTFFGAATVLAVGVVVFVSAFYTFLLQGQRLHEWLLVHAPLSRGHFHRFSSAFTEVGRGLLISVGLTALLQGAVATVGYVVCGVPQPLVLGLVTVFASLIPSIGSGLVWVPVTAGLWLSGRPGAAVAMLVVGCVVSVVDNAVRPLLAQFGELKMNGLLLFIAMLGGIAVFGASGLLLGPLLVRVSMEGLAMLREAQPQSFPAPKEGHSAR
jgi:predicted PurR-regulated permease PerM